MARKKNEKKNEDPESESESDSGSESEEESESEDEKDTKNSKGKKEDKPKKGNPPAPPASAVSKLKPGMNPYNNRNQHRIRVELSLNIKPNDAKFDTIIKKKLNSKIRDSFKKGNYQLFNSTTKEWEPVDLATMKLHLAKASVLHKASQLPYKMGLCLSDAFNIRDQCCLFEEEEDNKSGEPLNKYCNFVVYPGANTDVEDEFWVKNPKEESEQRIMSMSELISGNGGVWKNAIKAAKGIWIVAPDAPGVKLALDRITKKVIPVDCCVLEPSSGMFHVKDDAKTMIDTAVKNKQKQMQIEKEHPFTLADDLSISIFRADVPIYKTTPKTIWASTANTIFENPGPGRSIDAAFDDVCPLDVTLVFTIGRTQA